MLERFAKSEEESGERGKSLEERQDCGEIEFIFPKGGFQHHLPNIAISRDPCTGEKLPGSPTTSKVCQLEVEGVGLFLFKIHFLQPVETI